MTDFSKDMINNLLEKVTDVTFDTVDFSASYVYSSNNIQTKDVSEYTTDERKVFEALFKIITEQFQKRPDKKDYLAIFFGHSFRCNMINSVSGNFIHCRHMPFDFIELRKTGIQEPIINELMHPRLNKGGLIFIAGAPGNGKSTTAAGLIKERLKIHGGVCICLEDPVEIPLQGKHGNGRCIQVPVDTSFSDAIKSSLRSYPSGQNAMLFVGEMRDAESAATALQAAIDGRLVITTFHAEDLNIAFERMANLLSSIKTEEEAYFLIAQAFRVGIYQRLAKSQNKMTLRTSLLVDTLDVYSYIKNKKINGLQQARETQFLDLKNGVRIKYRLD
jgi:Tfp pilus assembly pilus retraction ATPase PilT